MNALDYQGSVQRAPQERPQPVVSQSSSEASLLIRPAAMGDADGQMAGTDNHRYAILGGSDPEAPVMLGDSLLAEFECGPLGEPVPPQSWLTSHFVLADALRAEETFSQAMQARALNVTIMAEAPYPRA